MSTLETNIIKLQEKIAGFEPGSRNQKKYIARLSKKYDKFMKYKEMRTREKSLLVKQAMKDGIEIDIDSLKITNSINR